MLYQIACSALNGLQNLINCKGKYLSDTILCFIMVFTCIEFCVVQKREFYWVKCKQILGYENCHLYHFVFRLTGLHDKHMVNICRKLQFDSNQCLFCQIVELEKRQSGSEQVAALQTELQQLTERLERVQLDNQDKQDVSSQTPIYLVIVFNSDCVWICKRKQLFSSLNVLQLYCRKLIS